ncbi:MAG: hypothetical protein QOE65_2662 [Solirubrobacteraceae bacterium]|nr:hypothetical protein [Solirubrobacteraceae bacterium]
MATRRALASELRGAGRREDAEAVAHARKPNRAASLVNQLVRSHPEEVRELLGAADAIRSARGREALEAASATERDALSRLTGALRELAGGGGASVDAARATLQAAAADPDVANEVLAGRLERERSPTGLAGFAAAGGPAPAARKRKPKPEPGPSAQERRTAQRAVTAARKRLDSAERALQRAQERAAQARADVAQARDRVSAERRALAEAESGAQAP